MLTLLSEVFPDLTLYERESILPFRQINNEDHELKIVVKAW